MPRGSLADIGSIPITIRNFVFSGSRLGSYLEVAIEPTRSNTEVLRGLAIEELSKMAPRCFQKNEISNCDWYKVLGAAEAQATPFASDSARLVISAER